MTEKQTNESQETKEQSMRKQCMNCVFWTPWVNQYNPQFTFGDCRLKEPANFHTNEGKFVTKWPSTKSTDFCGQFEPSADKANPHQSE